MREEEIVTRLKKRLIELAPGALERALEESRALEQLTSILKYTKLVRGRGFEPPNS